MVKTSTPMLAPSVRVVKGDCLDKNLVEESSWAVVLAPTVGGAVVKPNAVLWSSAV